MSDLTGGDSPGGLGDDYSDTLRANGIDPESGHPVLAGDFDGVEALVSRGFDSARIGVSAEGMTASWRQAFERAGRSDPVAPPVPYRFAGRSLVILPTFNERDNLAPLVSRVFRYLDCEVLVVDDESPDGTGELADRLALEHPCFHVLHRKGSRGLGKAYTAGFSWALERGFDRVFQMDCDFSHAAWDLPRLAHATLTADLAIGSRYVRGGGTKGWNWRRRQLSRAGNAYAQLFLGRSLLDWTSGFRAWRSSLLKSIPFDRLNAAGYSFQIELVWNAMGCGGRVREIPIRFVERASGQSKMDRSTVREAIHFVPSLRIAGRARNERRGSDA